MELDPRGATSGSSTEGVTDAECYVLGGGPVGEAVAERLAGDGHRAAVVDESYDSSELPGRRGDPGDVRTLEDAGVAGASTVVVATRRDRRNLLIAQLVSTQFEVGRILVLVNAPERVDLLAAAGHEPVCATSVLSDAVAGTI